MNCFYMGGNCLQIMYLPTNSLAASEDYPHYIFTLVSTGQVLNAIWFGAI